MERIYKYFGNQAYLDSFLAGEVYFNSLSFFLSCEDMSRRDDAEDRFIFRPHRGLQVTNHTTRSEFVLHGQLNSRVKNPDRIFIFCASTKYCRSLIRKFGAQCCVEVSNVQEFKRRIQHALQQVRLIFIVSLPDQSIDIMGNHDTRPAQPGVDRRQVRRPFDLPYIDALP